MSNLLAGKPEPTFFEVYNELEKAVITLHAKWNQFTELYASSEDTVKLLNETAAGFFRMLQRVLLDDVLQSICRLTDPAEMGPHRNLSLLRLPPLLESLDTGLQAIVIGYLDNLAGRERVKQSENNKEQEEIIGQVQYARDHRNWRISHSDHDAVFELKPKKQLPGFTREQVEESLKLIRDIMNSIRSQIPSFNGEQMMFEHPLLEGDAQSLVGFLLYAKDCIDAERKRDMGLPD